MAYRFEQFLSARSAYGPTVDPDGSRLYFLSDLTGSPALWSRPLGGGVAWPEPIAVGLDRVSAAYPSGRPGRLALSADVGGNERAQLYLLDGPGLPPRRLTEDDDAIHLFGGWHPDGRTIAYSSNERTGSTFEVYLHDVETGERRQVLSQDATLYAGSFSPDGNALLVQRVTSPSDHTIYVLDVASGDARQLSPLGTAARFQSLVWSADGRHIYGVTDLAREHLIGAALDPASGELTPLVEEEWDVEAVSPSHDGRWLAYTVNVGGASAVRFRDLRSGADVPVELPMGQVHDGYRWQPTFSWLPDSSGLLFAFSPPTAPGDVFLARPGGGAPERLTWSWAGGLEPDRLVAAELVEYESFDGRKIPAFVFAPPDAPRDGSRPVLFFVHGGPESQTRAVFNPVIAYFAQRGFTVVAPNVRGSSGYGNTYLHLDDVEKRMDSVRDLAAGAEWAVRSGLAHPRRIAVMGSSYGGFMVLAALTSYPELWAVGVDIVGIANFVTFLEHTGPWRRHLREAEYGSLARDRALLEEISPIHKVDRIAAPLFVVHGANDPRVPIGETEQIVASLRERGRPVEYLRFEDEGHGLVKLRNRVVAYPQIADFLERHLSVT